MEQVAGSWDSEDCRSPAVELEARETVLNRFRISGSAEDDFRSISVR